MQNINIYVLCFSILITEKNKFKEYATDKMFLHAIYSGNVHFFTHIMWFSEFYSYVLEMFNLIV